MAMNDLTRRIAALSSEKRVMLSKRLTTASEELRTDPIAIVGMSCRFPGGADSPEAFWNMLLAGRDGIVEVPGERWDIEQFYDADSTAPGKMSTRWGGFLREIDKFDADFFGISPREAEAMDPQQRLLLEVVWEALENAGQTADRLAGSQTGTFVGMYYHDYADELFSDRENIDAYTSTGNAHSVAVGRISYLLDLRGPSLAVDTACSSSLVAVHLACQSLRMKECNLALAGGVSLMLAPEPTVSFTKWGMMAPDGRCKTFDERADGFVRGEGCGVVVLKRLSDALNDGDRILAVIRGSAVNQDGRSNGLTAPSGLAQQEVIRLALSYAGVDPAEVGYIETHGTGTALGDPIEVEALRQCYGQPRPEGSRCALGAVKTNIGHLEAAAGIAGLIKAVLTLLHGTIPPNLHFRTPNPNLPLNGTRFFVPTEPTPWAAGEKPRFAAVSSFGFGGTNAHVVLEEAPPVAGAGDVDATGEADAAAKPAVWHVLPLSARCDKALSALAEAYRTHLLETTDAIADVCYTAAVLRTHYEHRLAVTGRTKQELAERLAAWANGEAMSGTAQGTAVVGQRPKLAFVFPGQGSQWLGMARELLDSEPVFRESIEACERAMKHEVDWSLGALLRDPCEHESQLERIDVIQPTLFAIQVSLVRLWESLGVRPDAVVGHSMGEVAAAHAAGLLTLEDAVKVICRRSKLLRRVSGQGAMAVVELPADEAEAALGGEADRVSVAVINSRRSTVLAGDPQALRTVTDRLEAQGVFCRRVKVDVASHSPQMDALTAELKAALAEVDPQAATIPMISTVGETAVCDARYWAENLRRPVRFAQAIEALLDDGFTLFVELSPHPILFVPMAAMLEERGAVGRILPSLRRDESEVGVMRESLAALYAAGYPVNWTALYPAGRCVTTPAYPWQRKRYWPKPKPAQPKRAHGWGEESGHPLLGERLALPALSGTHVWQTSLSLDRLPFLAEHRLYQQALVPGTVYIELALAAAERLWGAADVAVRELAIHAPLVLSEETEALLQTTVTVEADRTARFQVFGRPTPQNDWTLCASGVVRPLAKEEALPVYLPTVRGSLGTEQTGEDYYRLLAEKWFGYGASFRGIRRLWRNERESLAEVVLPEPVRADAGAYRVHPAMLDACFQAIGAAAINRLNEAADTVYVLGGLEELAVWSGAGDRLYVHVRLEGPVDQAGEGNEAALSGQSGRSQALLAALTLYDESGRTVGRATGLRAEPADGKRIRSALRTDTPDWLYAVEWMAKARATDTAVATTPTRPVRWLLCADEGGVAVALREFLLRRGDICTLIPPGSLDRATSEAVSRLLDEIGPVDRIVYLSSLDAAVGEHEGVAALRQTQIRSSLGAVRLVQALARGEATRSAAADGSPKLWLVTRLAQPVLADQRQIAFGQAPLWGIGRGIALEHPQLWGGLIDMDEDVPERTAALLAAEIDGADGEDQVAYRTGQRYVARFMRHDGSDLSSQPATLSPDGTYLLTGALGGLGLRIASWLAKSGARHLTLLSRRSPSAEQEREVREWAQTGVTVVFVQADLGDEHALARVFERFGNDLPPLRGVFHAAYAGDMREIAAMEEDDLWRMFQSKVFGTWNLHRESRRFPLDCFVLFSSTTSLFGSRYLAHYAAASQFLDAVVHYRRGQGLPALSVNWGTWDVIPAKTEEERQLIRNSGLLPMETPQALALLGRLLASGVTQRTVAAVDWPVLKQAYEAKRTAPFFAAIPVQTAHGLKPTQDASFLARLEASGTEERRELLTARIQAEAARILRLDSASRIDPDQGFFQIGMDSLMSVELKRRLEAIFGRTLPTSLVFAYPSVRRLVEYALDNLLPQASKSQEPAAQTEPDLSEEELFSILAKKLEEMR